ncbi:uncharacterized protein FOMMEDRAFT_146858 [Fomitiporia mediterranea MF3/22]|uniref:uncharacterized protein n=1 Tax=Fomitiporia mediterranea (strain MF3/22) TaxID=694068 RepID=UPI0004408E55|nr:uncharacterized protein FOMMEDRAFT_146858 [Fomitiporia mediterranea MF3/22]EJD03218.1 hypothetical protein FOMMEDRAFT_146858 [Fomitiporia mediterranea MF3/22]
MILPDFPTPFSLLFGFDAAFTSSSNQVTIPNKKVKKDRKRKHEKYVDSDPDSKAHDNCDTTSLIKKARREEDTHVDSEDEVENDLSIGTLDTTFVDSEDEVSTKAVDGSKVIDSRFDFTTMTPRKDDNHPGSGTPCIIISSSPPPCSPSPAFIRSPAPSPSPRSSKVTKYHPKGNDENNEEDNTRSEWELRWFICAHHTAFTAATGMSLRQEIRRRKVLSRMWRSLREENDLLKKELERLTGYAGVLP